MYRFYKSGRFALSKVISPGQKPSPDAPHRLRKVPEPPPAEMNVPTAVIYFHSMLRLTFITGLLLVLLAQVASPLCIAMANGSIALAAESPASEPTSEPGPQPADTHECWFKAAHLFKSKAPATIASDFSGKLLVLSISSDLEQVPALNHGTANARLIPDRSPPTQPLLQIFRI